MSGGAAKLVAVSHLVFTDEILARACEPRDALDPLVLQWAGMAGEEGARIRGQIERVAALVPEPRRARVLGPIAVVASDGQVKSAVGGILLAEMLQAQGWDVEFEPFVGTQTPDLRIRKGELECVVEIRRVEGRSNEGQRPRLLVSRALRGIRTSSPLHINVLQVSEDASLKPFRAHVEEVLKTRPLPVGTQSFKSHGVFVAYEVHDGNSNPVFPAVVGWPMRMIHGNDADRVTSAINAKLRAYKCPIIVALDLDGVMGGFEDVVEAFYGARKIHVPIHYGGAEPPGDAYLGPMEEGMLVGTRRDATRARERLVALLPFNWGIHRSRPELGLSISARVLENPAQGNTVSLQDFDPIPRFYVASRQDAETAMMQWQPPEDPKGWQHVP